MQPVEHSLVAEIVTTVIGKVSLVKLVTVQAKLLLDASWQVIEFENASCSSGKISFTLPTVGILCGHENVIEYVAPLIPTYTTPLPLTGYVATLQAPATVVY